MRKRSELAGQRFGRLIVISFSHIDRMRRSYWICQCDCGKIKTVAGRKLVDGSTKSCGCWRSECSSNRVKTHAMTNTRIFNTWRNMIDRCTNPKNKSYQYYGGKGVKICDEWLNDFYQFYSDMGDRPDGKTIDRIDVNGNYEPLNCRWSTSQEQSYNKSNSRVLTCDGVTLNIAQWAERLNITQTIIRSRLSKGFPIQQVLSKINFKTKKPL